MAISNRFLFLVTVIAAALPAYPASECDAWQDRHPDWIFCDDFEKGGALVAANRYWEYDDNAGDFKPVAGTGIQGGTAMRALWQSGEVEAGNLKLGFGRTPSTYFTKGIRPTSDFREIYYRMFVRMQKGFTGNPFKLSRATVMAKADWSQAMIAHVWGEDSGDRLLLDPARCTDLAGAVKCSGYNDFDNIQWIGNQAGLTPLFDGAHNEAWFCVEAHVKLNDAGASNGIHEFWIADTLEAKREGLNFLGSYSEYGINSVFFENYWNSGSPQVQERYFDNLVVSTKRIGCAESSNTGILAPAVGRRGSEAPSIGLRMGAAAGQTIRAQGGEWLLDGRKIGDLTPVPVPP